MEAWPGPAKELTSEEDFSKVERIASRCESWQSWNLAVAKWRGLLQTKDVAEHLGVSDAWVRNNLIYQEWHHLYKQKSRNGDAFFYHPEDVISQNASDENKMMRLKKLSFKRYQYCTNWWEKRQMRRTSAGTAKCGNTRNINI